MPDFGRLRNVEIDRKTSRSPNTTHFKAGRIQVKQHIDNNSALTGHITDIQMKLRTEGKISGPAELIYQRFDKSVHYYGLYTVITFYKKSSFQLEEQPFKFEVVEILSTSKTFYACNTTVTVYHF